MVPTGCGVDGCGTWLWLTRSRQEQQKLSIKWLLVILIHIKSLYLPPAAPPAMAPTWDGEEDDPEEAVDDALVKMLVEDVWLVDDILMDVTVAVAVVVNVDGVRPGTPEGRVHQQLRKPQTLNQSVPVKPSASASSSTLVTLRVFPEITRKMTVIQINSKMRRRHTI